MGDSGTAGEKSGGEDRGKIGASGLDGDELGAECHDVTWYDSVGEGQGDMMADE